MHISKRTRGVIEPPIVAFKRDVSAGLADRKDVIDLSQALPSYPPPPPVRDALCAAADGVSASRYTPDAGLDTLRESVAADLTNRYDASVSADEIMITPGANTAFHTIAHVLTDPGDTVTLMTPYYFNHAMSIELLGGRVAEWRPGPSALDVALDVALDAGAGAGLVAARDADTRRPLSPGGLLVVVNPSNPTGRTLSQRELIALDERCRAADVRLIVDETYLEFHAIERVPTTMLARPNWRDHAVVVGTYSKSLAMAGYRVGYIAAHPDVIAACVKVQDAQVVCAPHASQLAVVAALAWADLGPWLSARRREIDRRVDAFVDALIVSGSRLRVESSGAFFAYLVPDDGLPAFDGAVFARELASETGVLVLPGAPFGSGESRALRVAVGNADVPDVIDAAARITEFATRTLDR